MTADDAVAGAIGFLRERGVALGLENRLHHHEIPLPDEALALLAEYPPELVGYWHDVGHAEVQARLGYVDKRVWLMALGALPPFSPLTWRIWDTMRSTGPPGTNWVSRKHIREIPNSVGIMSRRRRRR